MYLASGKKKFTNLRRGSVFNPQQNEEESSNFRRKSLMEAEVGIALIPLCFKGNISRVSKESSGIRWNPVESVLIILVHVLVHISCLIQEGKMKSDAPG